MDYLDPKKEYQHRLIILTGYMLLAVAIVTATLILLNTAYGYGVKNGLVIQNGWAFFSSQPHPANISVNGTPPKANTNTRLELAEGIYRIKLSRNGYHDWQRTIELRGGTVEHFDYPLLIPKSLVTKKRQNYSSAPGFTTQSPDQRWLFVQQPDSMSVFEVYDLKNIAKPPISLELPSGLLSKAIAHETWQLEEWADDNQHVVLKHSYDDKIEYILVDRTAPEQSVNLNNSLAVDPTKLTLVDRKYDRYYLYDEQAATLQTSSLKTSAPITVLTRVLAYQSYSDDTLLYVTSSGEVADKVQVRLKTGNRTSLIRSLPSGSAYLLDLTKYANKMYVVAGATNQSKVFIYRDPVGQLNAQPENAVSPIQVLHVEQPNYVSFSRNAQYIVAENGSHFGVYDIENKNGFNYIVPFKPEVPNTHADWMDGNRLTYVSGGKLIIFDYDSTNSEMLMTANSAYLPAFAPDYKYVYDLASGSIGGQYYLTQTALLAPGDL